MERYLLDSSAIIQIITGQKAGRKVMELIENGELTTSIICYCEALNITDLDKQAKTEFFLSKLLVFPLTLSDGELAKKFQYNCRKTGKYVPSIDCLIAATASNNNATIVATDSDFERIEEVKKKIF